MVKLTAPLFTVLGQEISGRDLILLVGGLFLLGKATARSTRSWRARRANASARGGGRRSPRVIVQILLLDIVFSLDSVITAVGMADDLAVMIAAVVIAVGVMMFAAGADQRLRGAPPDDQDAGPLLPAADRRVADRRGLDQHIPKGYIYFAMAFSVVVEMLNLRMRKVRPRQ